MGESNVIEKLASKIWDNKLVKGLERYLSLDLKYYIKNSSYLISAQTIGIGLGLLLSIAFARLLSRDLFGQWNYILAIIGFLSIFTLPGMGTAIIQAVAKGHDRALIEGTKEKFKWSILGSVALFSVGIYYFLTGSLLLGQCLMISSVFLPFFQNFQTYNAFLSGKKQFNKAAKYQVIIQIISISITVLVIYFSRNLIPILIAYLLSISLLRGYFFRLTSKNRESESSDKEAIPFGKLMTVVGIPGSISQYGDKIILGLLLSFPALAIYSIALGVQNVIRSLMAPIAGLSFPKLSEMEEREAYSAVRRRYPHLIFLVIIICGICIALCPYVIPFLYSGKYVDSILYAQILLVGLIFGIPNTILVKALFPSQKQAKKVLNFEIVRIIIRTPLFVILTLKFHLLGAALSTLITTILTMLYSWKLAKWI